MSAVINGRLAEIGGWGLYQDTQYTTGARLTVSAGVRTKLPNNAGGIIETYLPAGGPSLYNGTTQKMTPSVVGDSYMVRIDFESASSTINNFSTMELDIGGGQGVISAYVFTYPRGTLDHMFSKSVLAFTLGTFVSNGGELFITPDDDIDIWGTSYVITRTSSPR